MYKIAMRNGSPVNVGQMIEIDKGSADVYPGYLCCIVDGEATTVTLGVCPDALVSEVNGNKLTAMLLTDDMILEAPSDGNPSNYKVGKKVEAQSDRVNVDALTDFCQIVDVLDAPARGSKILVRITHSSKTIY